MEQHQSQQRKKERRKEERKEKKRKKESRKGQLTTGITWVTPSPESMTVPVSVLSPTCRLVQLAARASTACTAMYNPGTLNDSNMISAVYSRFSGVFNGGSVCNTNQKCEHNNDLVRVAQRHKSAKHNRKKSHSWNRIQAFEGVRFRCARKTAKLLQKNS